MADIDHAATAKDAEAWAQQRQRARRLKQGARMVRLLGAGLESSHSAPPASGSSAAFGASPDSTELSTAHRHVIVTGGDDEHVITATFNSEELDGVAKIRMTGHMHEVVDLVLGTHWEACKEIVHSTVRDAKKKLDATAGRRAEITTSRLEQLDSEIHSKVRLQALHKTLNDMPLEEVLKDLEDYIKDVTSVVRKDHDDYVLGHVDFVNEFASFHATDLHDLLVKIGEDHSGRVAAREARIEHKKETRVNVVTKIVTHQVRAELGRDMEVRMWKEKTRMEEQMAQLRKSLREERQKREATELSLEVMSKGVASQQVTMQLALDHMDVDRRRMEAEIDAARSSAVMTDKEARKLAIDTRKKEAAERERLNQLALAAKDYSTHGAEEKAKLAFLNPMVWICLTKMQARVRGVQTRARLQRKSDREERMNTMREAVMAAARHSKQSKQQQLVSRWSGAAAEAKELADRVVELESLLSAEIAKAIALGKKYKAAKQAAEEDKRALEEVLAEAKAMRKQREGETASVSVQAGSGDVDAYTKGSEVNAQVSVLKEALNKLHGKFDAYGIGSTDIDAILGTVFGWLWEESDLYVLKPDGYQPGEGSGFLRDGAQAKIMAVFEGAGPLRPHPTIDDNMFRDNHGRVIPRGSGVQHVDLGEFVSHLGLEGSNSLVMLDQFTARQKRLATPPRTPVSPRTVRQESPRGEVGRRAGTAPSGRRPVPGGHRFAIGAQRLKGENRTPVKQALAPVAPGERVMQLNMEVIHQSIAHRNSHMRLGNTGPARGNFSARSAAHSRLSPRRNVGRPSYQAHSDGSRALPEHFEELERDGYIHALTPKLVVNWDLDHMERRWPDTSATAVRPDGHSSSTSLMSPSDARLAAFGQSSTGSLGLRSSGVPVPPIMPTQRGLLDSGSSLFDTIGAAANAAPPLSIAHVEHKFATPRECALRV